MRIVGVVDKDVNPAQLEQVRPTGIVVLLLAEFPQGGGHDGDVEAECCSGADRGEHIGDVVPGSAGQRDRNLGQGKDRLPLLGARQDDAILDREHRGAAPLELRPNHRRVGVEREPQDGSSRSSAARHQPGVVGVEDQDTVGREPLRDQQLRLRQLFQALDPELPEMILRHIGNDCGPRALDRQAAPEQTAPRGLQHRGLNLRMAQRQPNPAGAGEITLANQAGAGHDAVGRAVARRESRLAQHCRQQANHCGLSVRAGDQRDRHIVHPIPFHRVRLRQVGVRPHERTGSRAHRHLILPGEEREAPRPRRLPERDQSRDCFLSGSKDGLMRGRRRSRGAAPHLATRWLHPRRAR